MQQLRGPAGIPIVKSSLLQGTSYQGKWKITSPVIRIHRTWRWMEMGACHHPHWDSPTAVWSVWSTSPLSPHMCIIYPCLMLIIRPLYPNLCFVRTRNCERSSHLVGEILVCHHDQRVFKRLLCCQQSPQQLTHSPANPPTNNPQVCRRLPLPRTVANGGAVESEPPPLDASFLAGIKEELGWLPVDDG